MASLTTQVPVSEWNATLELLGTHGVTREHLSLIRSDSDRAREVARAIIGSVSSQPNSVAQARALLGKSFFGAEE